MGIVHRFYLYSDEHMYQYIKTICPRGLDGKEITIEIDSNRSLPTIDIIGLPDSAIKESKERLRATFRRCEIEIPARKFVINLAPSDVRKSGTMYDVAIATALLSCIYDEKRHHKDDVQQMLFFGELGLDGSVRGVQWLLPAVLAGIKRGYTRFVIPKENEREVSYVPGVELFPIAHFDDIVRYIVDGGGLPVSVGTDIGQFTEHDGMTTSHQNPSWWDAIRGHSITKRMIAIGICGFHNMLMVWPPGVGKSMLAQAIAHLLPPMHPEERLEASQIYSLRGMLDERMPCIVHRPFRHIHHTASKIAIVGGGPQMLPGEISLAHRGVLFLDEVAEFPRELLDTLRQPLEEKCVHITRAAGSVSYPASFLLVGAMNPCICGYYGDAEKPCSCSLQAVKKYQQKVSGPLLDRIDMVFQLTRPQPRDSHTPQVEMSGGDLSERAIRERIARARTMQTARYAGSSYYSNADLKPGDIQTYVPLDATCRELLHRAQEKLGMSMRVLHKTIKIARSIADFEGEEVVTVAHIAEALQSRADGRLVKDVR